MTIRRSGLLTLVAVAATFLGTIAESHAAGPFGLRRIYAPESPGYLTPVPVPAWVGHTHITYQPFQPHHHLWSHLDVYRRYEPGRALPSNVTRAYYW